MDSVNLNETLQRKIGPLPVWGGKTNLREMSGALLSTKLPGTNQGRDAIFRSAYDLASPVAKLAPYVGRMVRESPLT